DPETKKLREPTPDEQQATTPANVAPAAAIRENTYSDGSVQIELNDDYMTDVVAVRNADGTVTTTCVPRSAKAAPRASAPETNNSAPPPAPRGPRAGPRRGVRRGHHPRVHPHRPRRRLQRPHARRAHRRQPGHDARAAASVRVQLRRGDLGRHARQRHADPHL